MTTECVKFEDIAYQYREILLGKALKLTKNMEDAEDLVQETYLRAFRFYNKFERGTNFKAWIFKIMINLFINSHKKKERMPQPVRLEMVAYGLKCDNVKNEVEWINHNEEKCCALFDDKINDALFDLPEGFRNVVLLSDVEGFSYNEISQIMDIPKGTVMSRLFRGRKKLSSKLGKYAIDGGFVGGEV